jgi:hypothetical protein
MTPPPIDALAARLEALSTDALRAMIDEVASTPLMFALLERPALLTMARTLVETASVHLTDESSAITIF